MTSTPSQAAALRAEIGRAGFYPALVASAVTAPLGDEPVIAFLVHHDTEFLDSHGDTGAEPGMEMLRHLTALALTPTRLIHSHTDEYQDKDDPAAPPTAQTITGSVPLTRLTVTARQRIPGPAACDPAAIPSEVQVSIDWSSRWRADGGQDHCDDDSCQDFHGYLTLTGDDLIMQVSKDAHGPDAVTSALAFAADLARATSISRES